VDGRRHLIVGADGFVGSALLREARRAELDVVGTSRRSGALGRRASSGLHFLDLQQRGYVAPRAEVAYVVAGVVGYAACEGNAQAWRTNVDGTIALIDQLLDRGTFVVFMSSDAVEHMPSSAYGLQKAAVEAFLRSRGRRSSAFVRAGRINEPSLPLLCHLLLHIGTEMISDVHHFNPPSAHGLGR